MNIKNIDLSTLTPEQMKALLTAAQAENDALKAKVQKAHEPRAISFKVSVKGAVSAYGLGRFPVTLYGSQWDRLLSEADNIRAFLAANAARLAVKGGDATGDATGDAAVATEGKPGTSIIRRSDTTPAR